ncbi:MAG TPA: HIT domain-containing protein [Alcaligenaceae bacterium]|nr:HIT domain-containing protein [Alcaligenaceae bacterium]
MYQLHPVLANDTFYVGKLSLCDVLLMNDSRYPWLILVPRLSDIREIYELSAQDQQQFWQESSWVAEKLAAYTQADKMNVAALGNMVPQLHQHIIARHTTDAAWPQPVWGGTARAYEKSEKDRLLVELRQELQLAL